MRISSSLSFAFRLLFPRTGKKSNARRSLFGAFVCIGISLIPLVMVLTVSTGMIESITERMIGLSSSHIRCTFFPSSDYVKNLASFSETAEKISEIPGVKKVYPEIFGIGLASSSSSRCGATIRAVDKNIFEENESYRTLFTVIDGKPDLSRKNYVVIGEKLAGDLGVKAGDAIRIVTTKKTSSGNTVPKITPLKITAVVSSGYQELDALWVFISLEAGFSALSSSGSMIMGVESENAFDIELERTSRRIEDFLDGFARVEKWSEMNSSEYENFASTQVMLIFIMSLIVLVASVNISSALVMLVMERKKEIAIIKSLGGTSSGIAFSFLTAGMATSFLGLLFGLPLGILFSVNFYSIMNAIEKIINLASDFFMRLFFNDASFSSSIHLLDPAFYIQSAKITVPLSSLLVIAAGTILLSLIVSAVPALKAGKEKPIDTLRKI